MAKKKVNGTKGPKLYKAYFFRGRDPAIATVRAEIQRTNGNQRIGYKKLREMELAGGPSSTCMANWLWGDTQRPQNATIDAALGALGKKRVVVDDD